jgi:folylpolyglutamate synthase/dihydropteroate synthase
MNLYVLDTDILQLFQRTGCSDCPFEMRWFMTAQILGGTKQKIAEILAGIFICGVVLTLQAQPQQQKADKASIAEEARTALANVEKLGDKWTASRSWITASSSGLASMIGPLPTTI